LSIIQQSQDTNFRLDSYARYTGFFLRILMLLLLETYITIRKQEGPTSFCWFFTLQYQFWTKLYKPQQTGAVLFSESYIIQITGFFVFVWFFFFLELFNSYLVFFYLFKTDNSPFRHLINNLSCFPYSLDHLKLSKPQYFELLSR
jgi:hypothetical protein